MKKCELCNKVARMYCESDQASLCWDCDSRVHSANFLVAKHTRALLCHACQCPTPWRGSGPKLGPIVSVCEACVSRNDEEGSGDLTREEEEDVVDDDDGRENQVVPLSLASSSANSSDSYNVTENGGEKRRSWKWR